MHTEGPPPLRTFRKILIANRGEIALRVMRTCREMGIRTVAVYSDADRLARHVSTADEAVPIGPPPAQESYLRIDRIIEAARKTGAEAIHPGYGFLAENADFAEACDSAGLVFIGPPPAAIRAMGSKIEGRKLAGAAGVPIVAEGTSEFPLLIKASAGGGGRGMRIVRDAADLPEAMESARREAEKAFGDGTLLFERYIEGARHVEIQILGDQHGNLVHLFERDCSLQRRHQKIVEECPSPAVTPDLRERMGAAAVALARALHYSSAGTVEFLLSPNGEFFFIEVNTRIQVEHPVTEMVTGLDLIRLQIEIAEGRPLPPSVLEASISGHAIEARLYAEGAGTMHVWQTPPPGPGVRIEDGIAQGSDIGIHYDPMIAKIIAHGPDRSSALRKLVHAIESTVALGVATNREYLLQLLDHETFRAGEATTSFLPAYEPPAPDPAFGTAVALYLDAMNPSRIPAWYRNNPYRAPVRKFRINDILVCADRSVGAAGMSACATGRVTAVIDGVARTFHIHEAEGRYYVHTSRASAVVEPVPRHPLPEAATHHQTANSPMPGQVLRILVEKGQAVRTGDPLVVLEAMKMEQTIRTAIDGFVTNILVKPGEVIGPGQNLIEINAEETHVHTRS